MNKNIIIFFQTMQFHKTIKKMESVTLLQLLKSDI